MPDEKYDEKQEEKSAEKNWDEKWRRDPVSTIIWAAIFIWIGFVLLIGNLGLIGQFNAQTTRLPFQLRVETWSLIFIGIGVILLFEVALRLLVPEYRRPVSGTVILAFVFLGIGLGDIFGSGVVWAVILIALGVWVLARGFLRS